MKQDFLFWASAMACRPWLKNLVVESKRPSKSEFGFAQVDVVAESELLKGIEDRVLDSGMAQLDVWMSHGDKVTQVPPEF
jgi:GMP synthase-like glutamine amidotransferase